MINGRIISIWWSISNWISDCRWSGYKASKVEPLISIRAHSTTAQVVFAVTEKHTSSRHIQNGHLDLKSQTVIYTILEASRSDATFSREGIQLLFSWDSKILHPAGLGTPLESSTISETEEITYITLARVLWDQGLAWRGPWGRGGSWAHAPQISAWGGGGLPLWAALCALCTAGTWCCAAPGQRQQGAEPSPQWQPASAPHTDPRGTCSLGFLQGAHSGKRPPAPLDKPPSLQASHNPSQSLGPIHASPCPTPSYTMGASICPLTPLPHDRLTCWGVYVLSVPPNNIFSLHLCWNRLHMYSFLNLPSLTSSSKSWIPEIPQMGKTEGWWVFVPRVQTMSGRRHISHIGKLQCSRHKALTVDCAHRWHNLKELQVLQGK